MKNTIFIKNIYLYICTRIIYADICVRKNYGMCIIGSYFFKHLKLSNAPKGFYVTLCTKYSASVSCKKHTPFVNR